MSIIDSSIKAIVDCINNNTNIKYVLWSVEKNDTDQINIDSKSLSDDVDNSLFSIGLKIFKGYPVVSDAANYINQKIFEIFKNRKYYFSNKGELEHKKIGNLDSFYMSSEEMKKIDDGTV